MSYMSRHGWVAREELNSKPCMKCGAQGEWSDAGQEHVLCLKHADDFSDYLNRHGFHQLTRGNWGKLWLEYFNDFLEGKEMEYTLDCGCVVKISEDSLTAIVEYCPQHSLTGLSMKAEQIVELTKKVDGLVQKISEDAQQVFKIGQQLSDLFKRGD